MKIKLLWMLFILLSCATSYAQPSGSRYFVPNPFPNSPNSSAFTKYGDYKVSCFTGVPEISIPLYTVQSGGLQIPITLSYHASGNRVSDVASWVGLGWSVSNGGSITRRMVGLEDENSAGYLAGNWRNPLTIDLNANNDDIQWASLVVQGNLDSRPDIFSYDFPGYSGKFFFEGSNGYKPALIPYSPISIVNTAYTVGGPSLPAPNVPQFTVTDEHGNVSKFGYNNRETTMTTTPSVTKTIATAWMLESMVSQDRKDTISLSYTTQAVANPSLTTQYDLITDNVQTTGFGTSPYTMNYTQNAHNNSSVLTNVVENDVSEIKFKNGKVVFQMDAATRQDVPTNNSIHGLSNIKVYAFNFGTKAYQLQKSIVFYKSYFNPAGNQNQKRLRLDSIQVLDAAGGIMQHYRFSYNTSITLPEYDSFAKDYWDYYNGKTTSDALVPHMNFNASYSTGTTTYTIGSSLPNNRDPDSLYMQAYMLTSIAFPTGGHTDFAYQTNRYLDINNNTVLAGGLRVTSIKSYDGINPTPIVKTYQYNVARFNSFLGNSYFTNRQTHRWWGSCNVFQGHVYSNAISGTETYSTVNSNPQSDVVPYDGSIVVYPSVSEFTGTPGTNVGRTTYIFRDIGDGPQTSMSGVPLFESKFYQRGQLASKTDYLKKADGSYQIVKKDTNTYTAFPKNVHDNAGIMVDKLAWDEGPCPDGPHTYPQYTNCNDFNQFVAQNYSMPSDDNYLTGTTTYLYDQTDLTKFTTSTITNKFDNFKHQQVTRSYHADSKGNINVSTMKYPADYLSGASTGNIVLDSMLNRNMQAELIEKWDTVKNVSTSVNGVVSGQLNQFRLLSNMGGAEILGDKVSRLKVASPLTNFTPSTVVSGNLQFDSRYQQMISFDTYSYYNNLMQYTSRNSTPVSIIWDYNNALPVAQVKNAANGTAAYTSFEAGGMGGWSYSGIPVNDPTAPTGQNVYSLANGSVTTYPTDYSRAYVVSYWSNNGVATVYAGNYIAGTARRAASGWTYYEHLIPAGSTGSVTVSGTTSIDELAYYPQDGQLTTYTYDSNGVSDIVDTKGVITGFDYDFAQRLKNIRDWNGNIVKNYGYHNYDMIKTNDAISTPTLTRNNCPPGTNPTSTTFTVPAGKYSSSTKASANAEAQYDHDTYGQIYANKTCGCPVQMISFTLTNNTGATGLSANFSGPASYSFPFPASGSTTVQIPAGTYSLSLPPVAPFNSYHWKLGNVRTEIYAPSASFSNVIIGTGSTDSFLTVY
jgi:hypothetical protein